MTHIEAFEKLRELGKFDSIKHLKMYPKLAELGQLTG